MGVGLLRVFVSCCAMLLRVAMEVYSSVLRSSRTVWCCLIVIIIVPLGPSQLMHDSISFSLIAVEEDFGVS